MKNILSLIGLLFTFNIFAQELNLPAVVSGNTGDLVCLGSSAPGEPDKILTIGCRGKIAPGGFNKVNLDAFQMIYDFVASGKWELSATRVGKQNSTGYIFIRK